MIPIIKNPMGLNNNAIGKHNTAVKTERINFKTFSPVLCLLYRLYFFIIITFIYLYKYYTTKNIKQQQKGGLISG